MRRHGDIGRMCTRPTPCQPRAPRPECLGCARYAPGVPTLPECRPTTVLLDVALFVRHLPACPMRLEVATHA